MRFFIIFITLCLCCTEEHKSSNQKKYVLCILDTYLPSTYKPNDITYKKMLEIPGMLSWENETIISPVIEFDFFDKKVEKKTLGDIEANYKKFIYSSKEENWPIKIGYQDCIEFNDFEEASNLRATLILKDCFTQFNY